MIKGITWLETRLSEIGGGEGAHEKGWHAPTEEKLSGHHERLTNLQQAEDRQGS